MFYVSPYKKVSVNGRKIDEHRLIVERYLGRRLDSFEVVHHCNGNTRDNRLSNLDITTRSDHAKQHYLNGDIGFKNVPCKNHYYVRGSRVGTAVLTENDVVDIKRFIVYGMSDFIIGRMFNVNHKTINRIRVGESWKHV